MISAFRRAGPFLALALLPCLSLAYPRHIESPSASHDNVTTVLVIDDFRLPERNSLGYYHGMEGSLPHSFDDNQLILHPNDSDAKYSTQLSSDGCFDLDEFYPGMYLHIVFTGSSAFTISLDQNNIDCDSSVNPYPETWDSVQASRYVHVNGTGNDLYVPLSHFNIDRNQAISVSLHGFYKKNIVHFDTMEIVSAIPRNFTVPEKIPTAQVVLKCKRPNSFAFGIDDGAPELIDAVVNILEEEDIKVTFFAVGSGLDNDRLPFKETYRKLVGKGHQLALHSFTHPPYVCHRSDFRRNLAKQTIYFSMEGLSSTEDIDHELSTNIRALNESFGVQCQCIPASSLRRVIYANIFCVARYFRPPYGTLGARTLERLTALVGSPAYSVGWSVDIEDWIYAESDTPEKQFDAFVRDLISGGNLAVFHYLHSSTVEYLVAAIKLVKDLGLDIMRVDQCMEDTTAPAFRPRRAPRKTKGKGRKNKNLTSR